MPVNPPAASEYLVRPIAVDPALELNERDYASTCFSPMPHCQHRRRGIRCRAAILVGRHPNDEMEGGIRQDSHYTAEVSLDGWVRRANQALGGNGAGAQIGRANV